MGDPNTISKSFNEELGRASSTSKLDALRVRYLGKKGLVPLEFKKMGKASPEERKTLGQELNKLKASIESQVSEMSEALRASELKSALESESLDVTLPGPDLSPGRPHPVNQVLDRIIEIFSSMGFGVEEGPEVETDHYNFEALNIPKNHPARDMQDTFYVSEDVVMRTHTSPVQIRAMNKLTPITKSRLTI